MKKNEMVSAKDAAKFWELAVISTVSDNGQYFVGGREMLGQATKYLGLLAQQNQISVQYEALGENFEASEGICRTKVTIGEEEYYGGGNSPAEAKQAAALQALRKTIYVYDDLPAMLNPAPAKFEVVQGEVSHSESVEGSEDVTDETDSWQIYQCEDIEQDSVRSSTQTHENGSREDESDEEKDMEILCIATIWDFAGKIQVAQNKQYLVGGKELLKNSKKLMGLLSRQNDIQVEYEAVDDEIPLEEGQIMLKVIFGDESYFGSGDTVEDAKIAASLQVLLKTNYKFKELPASLTPAPANAAAGKVISEYPTELDGIVSEQVNDSVKERVAEKPKTEALKDLSEESEMVADNGQYYVEGETVERQSQYLISTMASQNKIIHKYELIEKCKSSSWVNWIAVRLIHGDESYNGSGESEADAKKAAAMMALHKTKYKFKSQFLPAGLKPTPMQKSSELDSLEQGIEKLRRVPEFQETSRNSAAYLEEMELEKEMDMMLSGVDFEAGSGQFIIDEFVRKACKYLIAKLASQNQFAVRYYVLGDNLKPEKKKCKVRLKVKTEEYMGQGPTIRWAKKNASLKALRKTKFTFRDLPVHVKIAPGWTESVKTEAVLNKAAPVSDSNESEIGEIESGQSSCGSPVNEEPMEVDATQEQVTKVKKRKVVEEELEEGEIVSDDEDEDGQISSPLKEAKLEPQRNTRGYVDKNTARELSLEELGLPTSFAMK